MVFFVILVIAIIVVTLTLTKMHAYDTRTIGHRSLFSKQMLALYVAGVWLYCIIGLTLSSEDDLKGKGDKYVVIVEWNTVIFCLLWVLSFAEEWKAFALTLRLPKAEAQSALDTIALE